MRSLIIAINCLLFALSGFSQTPCTTPGQTPSTALPLCGKGIFSQTSVPLCGDYKLPGIHCPTNSLTDRNPFWYKFKAIQSGSLGFVITPATLNEDYDWELYDVTGQDPNSVYTNGNLVIASNWSGETGITGASSAGTNPYVCGGGGQDLFSRMPTVQAGHDYLLLISHFTNTQSGYTIEFKGGTSLITDTSAPRMNTAQINCANDVVTLALKKTVRCSSISADGSDFFISPSGGASVIGFTSKNCSLNQFDTDSIQVRLDRPLPPGNYTIGIKQGNDGNTLLDNCNVPMPLTETATFTVTPPTPTPIDSLAKLSCANNRLRLVFSRPMMCNSILPSDFLINGPYPLSVIAANGTCSDGKTTVIELTISEVMTRRGDFTLELQRGADGNTILNECGVETPVGSSIAFQVKDTVNADFTYSIQYGCTVDVVHFSHPGANEVNKWTWKLDQGLTSNLQSPQASYTVFTPKNIELIVTNGVCSDTSKAVVTLDNFLSADFTTFPDNCPQEPVVFTSNSIGKRLQHNWTFGDGGFGTGVVATHIYAPPVRETVYNIRYTVTDSFGCSKTVQKPVTIYNSCIVKVPNAFTPNNDRTNDFLYPLNAVKAEQLEFTVYNRWGQVVYRTSSWKQGWDGRLYGQPQPSGTYVWLLRYIDRDTKKRIEQKGFTILIR